MAAAASAGSTEKAANTFEVKGANGQTIVIPPGRWHITTKARPERLMKNSLSKAARQIYACGDLGTMAFKQEVAIVRRGENGEPDELMTKAWIQAKTGLSDRDYRRGFVELEEEGMALRRPIDPSQPLQNGNIELCFWAEPLPPKAGNTQAREAPPLPDWIPESAESLLKRLKIKLPEDLDPGERIRLVEVYEREAEIIAQSEKRVREAFNPPVAPPPSNKEERKERIERNSSSSAVSVEPPAPAATEDPERRRRETDSDLTQTREALLRNEVLEGEEYVQKLAGVCRAVCPDATDEEIAVAVGIKSPLARDEKTKAGFLLFACPPLFDRGGAITQSRARRQQEAEEAVRREQAEALVLQRWRDELNDPDEDVRRFAREGLIAAGEPVPRE